MYIAQVSTRVGVARTGSNGNSNAHLLNHLPFTGINQFDCYTIQLIEHTHTQRLFESM